MDFAVTNTVVTIEIVLGTLLALGIIWLSITQTLNQTGSIANTKSDPAVSGCRVPRALKYHPIHVAAHWFVVFAMAQLLTRGALVMIHVPNSSPAKINGLRAHAFAGTTVLILVMLRLILLRTTRLPEEAKGPSPALDLLKRTVHPMLYVSVCVQAFAGVGMAIQADLPRIFFVHEGSVPQSFWIFPLRYVHHVNSRILMALIALHICGAIYHTFVMKDGLLRRMSFGRRFADVAQR